MIRKVALAASMFCAVPNVAEASLASRSKSDASFSFPAGQPVTILVFRPDVQVGSLGMGGVESPNADWTAKARDNLAEALRANQQDRDHKVVFLMDQEGENARTVADYQALFRAVAHSVVTHKFGGARLPTKKDKFDWTLGPGAAKLGEIGGGNYGLLLYSHDAFGTAGRKVMQLMLAGVYGLGMQAGVHGGYAALVDLKTGNLVWFGIDAASGGDPRQPDGASKRIRQLLKTMPGQSATIAEKTAAR